MNASLGLEIGLIIAAGIGSICVVLASVHDLRQIRLIRKHRRSNRRRPQVSVLVAVHHANDDLAACMRSIRRLRYRHYDIVVFAGSDVSKPAKQLARQAAPYGRVYIARKSNKKKTLIRRAYERSQRGEMVLLLDASQTVSSRSLNRAVTTLASDTKAGGVVLGSATRPVASLHEMVDVWQLLSQKLVMKAAVATGLYSARNLYSGRLYRSEAVSTNVPQRLTYDSKTTIEGGVRSSPLAARLARYVLIAGVIAAIAYVCILAASLQTAIPLLLTWSVVMVWIFITIWLDDTAGFWQRIGLTVGLPLSYFAIISKIVIDGAEKILRRQTI